MTDNRTTELREKLTERGIEYTTNDHMGAYETSWNGFTAMQLTPGAKLIMTVTPEQAIAATVGNGTCENANKDGYGFRFDCTECGYSTIVLNCATRLDELPSFCPKCGRWVKR